MVESHLTDCEQWREIPDYNGHYSISNHGRVRRNVGPRVFKERILRPADNGNGYLKLALSHNSKVRYFLVHRLVLLSFVGQCPDGCEVNHKDGNKTNNFLSNLEYVTPVENQRHRYDVLGHPRRAYRDSTGVLNPKAKLTVEHVRQMRAMYDSGEFTKAQISMAFGIGKSQTRSVVCRESWKSVV